VIIRGATDHDLPALVEMTIETFRPFYEGYVHSLLGDELFDHQHGQWEQDYREEVPTLHDRDAGREIAVAEWGGVVAGYIAWKLGPKPQHGEITILAVSGQFRRHQVGRRLCEHAIAEMRDDGVDVVGIGTGDDAFHAAARGLYESMGFIKIPIAGYLKNI
jgi:ribosomal protein S18 acetylase RimI-like enzyme